VQCYRKRALQGIFAWPQIIGIPARDLEFLFLIKLQMKNVFKQIFLADDDADDRSLFAEALDIVSPESTLTIARNGMELMHFLSKAAPDMLFLDLNMPLKDGTDCIKWIRDLKELKHILVVAYSSAFDEIEINKAYNLGMNLYFIKPTRLSYLINDLNDLFDLDWSDPEDITNARFIDNRYTAFNEGRAGIAS
jgi:CheY-like chemotaxis protein